MKFIAHRINTIQELTELPREYGVEIDLRPYGDRLVLQHDPFKDGVNFEDYLPHYQHGPIILNIKSERIEYRVLEALKSCPIQDYFFYDSSFSMICELVKAGVPYLALAYSEFDGLATLTSFAGKVEWVWIHCFTKFSLSKDVYEALKGMGYKLCFASPELYGRPEDLPRYIDEINTRGYQLDAVCTKQVNIDKWKTLVNRDN